MVDVHKDMWVLYKNSIPVDKVKCSVDIPRMNPEGIKYKRWWKEEKLRSIEGYWVEHDGLHKFVPGPLYFYVNFWRIKLTPKNSKSKAKRAGAPFLRDIDWLKAFVYEEARGFSGFEGDEEISCHRLLEEANPDKEPELFEELLMEYGNPDLIKSSLLKPDGSFKKYVPARDYLREYFTKSYGMPMYYNMAKNIVDMESRGGGKELPNSEGVLLPSGITVPIGSLKEGDVVVGKDGNPTNVLQVFPQGVKDVYNLKLQDGRVVRCGIDHQWQVYESGEERVITTRDLISEGLQLKNKYKFKIDNCEPIDLPRAELPIDPYILGVDTVGERTPITEEYKKASIDQRLSLLQGMLDTGGSITEEGSIEFTNTDEKLLDDLIGVARSLGIECRKGNDCKAHLRTGMQVFRLPEKLARVQPLKKRNWVAIESITKLDYKEESTCIMVDNKDKTFLTTDFVVTHNSFNGAGNAGHNFLFDGATDYGEYLAMKREEEPMTSETLIGAIDAKFSKDLISKVKYGFDKLPGAVTVGSTKYPPPLSKSYSGSWDSGETVTSGYSIKKGGVWETEGSSSKLQHRSFQHNHTAANGTRPSLSFLDEVGFMYNLQEVLGQMKEAAADGSVKQGVIWMMGTGGSMASGATESVKQVFYDPEAFDCLAFDDEFENYQSKIGFFIPTWMTLNQFKDDLGNTNWEAAVKYVTRVRDKLKKNAKQKSAYEDEIVQRPMSHSEVFLLVNNSILPVADLKEHMDSLLPMQDDPNITGKIGWMHLDADGSPIFKLDVTGELRPADYPVKPNLDNKGAVVIWEMPDANADYGWYVAGNDPYDFDVAPNSVSLGSVIVIRRGTALNGGFDRIVAEYTGRPPLATEFYEQVRRLLLLFGNAVCLYENEKQQIKEHFKKMFSIGLLAYTPGVLKANETSKTAKVRIYGQHMSGTVKDEAEIYLREWLLTPIGDGKLQLHTIKSIPLLKELISYNKDGNYDRVIAMMLAIIQLIQMRTVVIEELKDEIEGDEADKSSDFFDRKIFTSNMMHAGYGR